VNHNNHKNGTHNGAPHTRKHRRVVLVIGDSNGAAADGWPALLKGLIAADVFINNSESGRTLGFNNPEEDRNCLVNLDSYLDAAVEEAGEGLDDVVLLLGTNDCKACFDIRQAEVEGHLRAAIEKIRKHNNGGKWSPRVMVVSPPPYGKDEVMQPKYHGGAARARHVAHLYHHVAMDVHTKFVDAHALLEPIWDDVSPDGVHMDAEAQKIIARAIAERLNHC
jgi:lysophospholipase L1-like esterase